MEKLTKKEFNCETGEETIVELTEAEVAEYLYQIELAAEKKAEEDAKAEAAAIAKAALLERLGITAEEAALLLA